MEQVQAEKRKKRQAEVLADSGANNPDDFTVIKCNAPGFDMTRLAVLECVAEDDNGNLLFRNKN